MKLWKRLELVTCDGRGVNLLPKCGLCGPRSCNVTCSLFKLSPRGNPPTKEGIHKPRTSQMTNTNSYELKLNILFLIKYNFFLFLKFNFTGATRRILQELFFHLFPFLIIIFFNKLISFIKLLLIFFKYHTVSSSCF